MKKRKKEKAQASFEYILTAAIVGMVILPAAYLFYRHSKSAADEIDKAQLDRLGREIISTAEKVYFQGAPSRTTLEAMMPTVVQNISIAGNVGSGAQMLLIRAATQSVVTDFPFPTRVNIRGSFDGSLHDVTVSPGVKKINIESYELGGPGGQTTSFAFINAGGRCPASSTYDFNTDRAYTVTDVQFFTLCYCNCAGFPKYRPSKSWISGWFDSTGYAGGNVFAACMNADYNGDCIVDDSDVAPFCAAKGFYCGSLPACGPC